MSKHASVPDDYVFDLDPGKAILEHHEKVFGPFPPTYDGSDAIADICDAIDFHREFLDTTQR
jgi:hypothetical protein